MTVDTRDVVSDKTLKDALARQEDFEAKLEAERQRLRDARAELEKLDEQLGAADPDAKVFEQFVARREVSRARVAALETREASAAGRVEVAIAAVARAREQIEEQRIAQVREAARALDADISRDVREFRTHLGARIRELRALVDQVPAQFSYGLRLDVSQYHWAWTDEANSYRVAAALFPVGR